jgi:3-oxoacyl-[acyl-carrier protein] reductase
MAFGIQGKWALVCGASKGLGFACAQSLAEQGVNLVIVARTAGPLLQAAEQLKNHAREQAHPNVEILTVSADITTAEGREQAMRVSGGPERNFDIIVTNAGGPPPGDFRQWDRDAWVAALDANMLTPIELMKAAVDGMAQRGFGRVVNITSSAVKAPIDILGLSNGARSGLTGFVAGLSRTGLAESNVTINNILPGFFGTDRLRATLLSGSEMSGRSLSEETAARVNSIPAKRLGRPEEFGALCAFLCSQQASYITGQNILIDGGAFRGVL